MGIKSVNFDLSAEVSYPKRPDLISLEKGLLTRFSHGQFATLELTVVNGPTVTLTQQENWIKGIDFVPRVSIYHKGLTKVDTVLKGWMAYVSNVAPNGYTVKLLEQTESVHFHPNTPHVVLLGPGALVQTTTWGKFVSNPQAGGEDRWPLSPAYDRIFSNWKQIDYPEWCRDRHNEQRLRDNHMAAD
jgi:hypothetical protein